MASEQKDVEAAGADTAGDAATPGEPAPDAAAATAAASGDATAGQPSGDKQAAAAAGGFGCGKSVERFVEAAHPRQTALSTARRCATSFVLAGAVAQYHRLKDADGPKVVRGVKGIFEQWDVSARCLSAKVLTVPYYALHHYAEQAVLERADADDDDGALRRAKWYESRLRLAVGAAADAAVTVLTFPVELLGARLFADHEMRYGGSVVACLRECLERDGAPALFRGVGFALAAVVASHALAYGFMQGFLRAERWVEAALERVRGADEAADADGEGWDWAAIRLWAYRITASLAGTVLALPLTLAKGKLQCYSPEEYERYRRDGPLALLQEEVRACGRYASMGARRVKRMIVGDGGDGAGQE